MPICWTEHMTEIAREEYARRLKLSAVPVTDRAEVSLVEPRPLLLPRRRLWRADEGKLLIGQARTGKG